MDRIFQITQNGPDGRVNRVVALLEDDQLTIKVNESEVQLSYEETLEFLGTIRQWDELYDGSVHAFDDQSVEHITQREVERDWDQWQQDAESRPVSEQS